MIESNFRTTLLRFQREMLTKKKNIQNFNYNRKFLKLKILENSRENEYIDLENLQIKTNTHGRITRLLYS